MERCDTACVAADSPTSRILERAASWNSILFFIDQVSSVCPPTHPFLLPLLQPLLTREGRGSRLTSSSRLLAVRLFERTSYLGGLIKLPVKRSTVSRGFPIKSLLRAPRYCLPIQAPCLWNDDDDDGAGGKSLLLRFQGDSLVPPSDPTGTKRMGRWTLLESINRNN